jgi:hypothetical protein
MRAITGLIVSGVVIGLAPLSAHSADSANGTFTPFVMLDVGTEKDSVSPVKNEYFNKHITVGVKTPGKWEYSLRMQIPMS